MATLKVKRGSGTPTGLTAWELAYDATNGRFYVGNTTGSPIVIGISGANNVVTSFNGATGAITGVNSWNDLTGNVSWAFVDMVLGSTGIQISNTDSGTPPYPTTVTVKNTGVWSFNGSTGAIQGVSALNSFTGGITLAAGVFMSVANSGKSITFTNEGVRSFNGLTGTVTGVTTGTTNNFIALQSFSSGISCSGATFNSIATFNGGLTATAITGSVCTVDYYRISSVPLETKTAGFTLTAADNGKIFLMGNTANAIMYFPTGLPVGFKCDFIRRETGPRVRFFESGTTIESKSGNSPEMSDNGFKGEQVSALQVATNVFAIYGDLL